MIYGNRLRLRAAEREDLPRFVAWLNDPEVRQYLLLNSPLSMANEELWFENMIKQPASEQVMVIEVKLEEGWKPVGNTAFQTINWVNRYAEIGIFIGEKEYWNRGYGREAVSLMLRHGFNTLNLHRIYLRVHENNVRGIKAYEHAGFKLEGRLREDWYMDGRYDDTLIMSVLSQEWRDNPVNGNQSG